MGVLKGFLYFCAASFALAAVILLWYRPIAWPLWLVPAMILAGLAWVVYGQAKKFGVTADASQAAQFEATARSLAEKNGGKVALQALVQATGEPQEAVTAKMRALVGRGVFDLDFGDNGEQLYKLTPLDEARASLARQTEKS